MVFRAGGGEDNARGSGPSTRHTVMDRDLRGAGCEGGRWLWWAVRDENEKARGCEGCGGAVEAQEI